LKNKANAKNAEKPPITDQVDKNGRTILHRTWEPCFEQWAILLLRHSTKAGGIQDRSDYEPVHYAANKNQPHPGNVIKALLRGQPGARLLDAKDRNNDWTPLMMAASRGDTRPVAQLLTWGAGWDHLDSRGRDAFCLAYKAGDTQSAGYLLLRGAGSQLNKEAKLGRRTLHVAARYGRLEMVRWLLRYDADKDVKLEKPFEGCTVADTPAEVAQEVGYEDVARAIEEWAEDGLAVWPVLLTVPPPPQ